MGILSDIGGGIGDIFGGALSADDRAKALAAYQGLQAEQTGPSAYLSADPAGRSAQMDALSQLRNQVSQGGLDAISRANLADTQNQNNQMARTQQAGIMDQAARNGTANSGNALLGQMVAGQGAANRNATQGLQVAGQQQQARQQAVAQEGTQASQMRSQDYDRAAALDSINKFNASQRQNMDITKAAGVAGQYNTNADGTQKLWGGIGKGVGAAGDAAALGG